MIALDSLVVTTALPVIKQDLDASLAGLEWSVNAYTLTFAVLLLTGAALGDRFGRRRLFIIGLAIFTTGSAAAALAQSTGALVAARAVQGVGGAILTPLTLTILSAAVPPARRGVALGAWGAVSGLAIALGPLVGGAVVQGLSWQWIFWLNVPIGLAAVPLAAARLPETTGPDRSLDLPGLALAGAGLLGVVFGLVRGNDAGWASLGVAGPLTVGALLLVALLVWEARTTAPMIPLRFFRSRGFSAANATSLLLFFGMFGSIFLLTQFLQLIRGYSPLEAGLRTLPWTGMLVLVGPLAGRCRTGSAADPWSSRGWPCWPPRWPGWRQWSAQPSPMQPWSLRSCWAGWGCRCSCPHGQCRAVGGRPGRGGQGLRRPQHHPPGRRRVRGGGPCQRVLHGGGLWLTRRLCGRTQLCTVGRRRHGRAGSGHRAGHPEPQGDPAAPRRPDRRAPATCPSAGNGRCWGSWSAWPAVRSTARSSSGAGHPHPALTAS
ncbi:MAG TPA: MFS transporter [Actinomycetes bacterium]|nr:MFS transporter [Actinomycetes bacterium]